MASAVKIIIYTYLVQKVPRLRVCKRTVPKYYDKNESLFLHSNTINEIKVLSYCETLEYMLKYNQNIEKVTLHYVKHINPLSFQIRF